MEAGAQVMVRRVAMSARAHRDLAPVMLDPEVYGIDGLAADVVAGHVALFGIYGPDGKRCGSLAARWDEFTYGTDLVLIACRARLPGVDLTETLLEGFEKFARRNGARRVRLHTERAGLVYKAVRRGYRAAETVLVKQLSSNA